MENIVFKEQKPSAALEPYVQTYWQGSFNIGAVPDFTQTVQPNGCIELIIHVSHDHCMLPAGSVFKKSPEFTLMGLYETPYEVHFQEEVRVFGIRFYPDGIRNVFGVQPQEFNTTYEDPEDVIGRKVREFCEKIREMTTMEQQSALADILLEEFLGKNYLPYDYTHKAMKLIRQSGGMGRFETIIEKVPISLRQLQREFRKNYGISPTDYMRILRINAIQNYMMQKSESLTELSYNLDFSDQSHFIREFKTFAGTTPGKFSRDLDRYIVNPRGIIH